MEGFVLVGYILIAQLCRLDGENPVDCKQLPPMQRGGSAACETTIATVAASFPNFEPEAFGFPPGTRMHIKMTCKPLYGPLQA